MVHHPLTGPYSFGKNLEKYLLLVIIGNCGVARIKDKHVKYAR